MPMPYNTDPDTCIRCGQSLRLSEIMADIPPVAIPGRGELCPMCYRELSPEEYQLYLSP